MQKHSIETNLANEEKQALKWLLILFYAISIIFDIVFNLISKYIPKLRDGNQDFLGIWLYVLLILLIPVAHYLNKSGKYHLIKYTYFITYTFLTFLNEIISYIDKPDLYKGGNAVEIFWLLLAPIFVNTKFLKVVSIGIVLKYIIVGLIIKSPNALLGILLVGIFSVFSFILLKRFQSYVKVIKISYDQQLDGMVKGVIATLELKDPYTKGHSERVAQYSMSLAQKLNKFTKDELKNFYYACLLHDIGKVNIPDHILMKASSLSNSEYEIIKTHTLVGAEAVSKVEGFNTNFDVIKYHHERWDGTGYPDRLKGKEIPELARIAAIADAFDAMTSTRSYRAALSVEEAKKRIDEGIGTQFDPELVKVFQVVYAEWIKIHRRINEVKVVPEKVLI